MYKNAALSLLSIVLLFGVFSLSCNSNALLSRWRHGQIVIDGSDADWGSSLTVFEKEKIAVGVANDSDNLYLCLKVLDRSTQTQIIRRGLTLWFDSTGGNDRVFGVHFPIGLQASGFPERAGEQQPGEDRQGEEIQGGEGQNDRSASRLQELSGMLHEMEILGPTNIVVERLSTLHAAGLEASLSDSSGSLVYELKLPLRMMNGHPYAIGADPGNTVGVGLETGQFRRSAVAENRPAEGGGGRGRRGGGGGGGRGGMRGGGRTSGERPAMPDPLKVWATVRLASESSSTPAR
jgi:hypothetical protein